MLSFEALEKRTLLSMSAQMNVAAGLANLLPTDVVPAQANDAATASNNSAVAPQAASVTAITSVRDGFWSDPTTWSNGRVPGSTDDVVISNNVTIDHAQVHELDINAATATLAGDLHAFASVIVRSHLVGTQGGIYFHVADDRLFTGNTKPGPDPALPDFHPEDTGLWVLPGGSINLQGADVTSWLNAVGAGPLQDIGKGVSQEVAFGGGNATLQSAPTGWRPGDTLLLVNEQGQSVLADLVSVNGTSLQYHEHKANPTDADLIGHTLITSGISALVYSKIANLTRRIQIVGADVHEGDTNHRAHTNYLNGAAANLVNVEFRDLGPRGKLGRYPVYFDQGGPVISNLTGSSIWQDVTDPGNRFVAIHAVQGLTVANNVAFRSQGDGFFMEDGSEYGNAIINNLSVQVTGGEELPNANSNVTGLSHHFWLRTGNTISGNVAAGGDAVGMMILASSHPGATVVTDTQVLGAGLYGMWTGTPNVTFNNPVAVYNSRAGFASDPAWDVDSHGTTLNNPLFLFNGSSDSSYGSQIFLNDSGLITVNGGVLAGVKAVHTHYHSAFIVENSQINVDTLLTPTYWEQAGTFDHDSIHASLLFERAYPAPRYASPGIVHFVDADVQIGTGSAEEETSDYMGDNFQNYPALQGTPIPNAIELSQTAPASGFIRVTLLPDDQRWMTNIARWTVTPIGQTPQKDSYIYHRQTAWTTLGSLGGYPDGFPPGQYAVSLYTDSGVFLKSGFAVVQSGQVSDITDTLGIGNSQVVGRKLFYNNSMYDANNAAATTADDNAIASDKSAYLPGLGASTFANVSSYDKGINGIMVDLLGGGSHTSITQTNITNDFTFKVGNNNSLSTWTTAPNPSTITVRAGAGVGGSDRVELVWPDGAIKEEWLEVITKATTNTGLAANDVFFFGSAVANSGGGDSPTLSETTSVDELGARNHDTNLGDNIPVTNLFDYNRDDLVNSADSLLARNNVRTLNATKYINVASAGPLAPGGDRVVNSGAAPAESSDAGVASALAGASSSPSASRASTPAWIINRLSHVDLNSGAVAKYLEHLVDEGTAKSRAILVKADQVADALNLDDTLLDSLLTF
jgi:hypothetical protein